MQVRERLANDLLRPAGVVCRCELYMVVVGM